MKKTALFLSIATAVLVGHAAYAEDYYRWTDETGTHYAETPPIGVVAEKVKSNGSVSGEYDPNKEVEKTKEGLAERQKQQDHAKEVEEAQKKKAEELDKKCKAASTQQKTLSDKHRVRVMNPDGTEGWLTEEQRLAKLQETETFFNTNCQGK
jgi:hypothetical protein